MRLRNALYGLALVGTTALVTARVVSQDQPAAPDPAAIAGLWEKYATPGPEHRKLDAFVGKWEQAVTWWVYPGAEPSVSSGSVEYAWILDGRYLKGTYEGSFDGAPFKGLDMMGYDRFRGEYFAVWFDNMSTGVMVSRGQFDPRGRTLLMSGMVDDIMSNQRDKPFRTTTTHQGKDTVVYEMFTAGPDGREFQAMQVTSTRAK